MLVTHGAAQSGKGMGGRQYYAPFALHYFTVFLGESLNVGFTEAGNMGYHDNP